MSDSETRRRLITLGEIIAIAALIVSGIGVWIAWKSSIEDKPTRVVEHDYARGSVARARRSQRCDQG
jgi:hypothetical protein